MKELVLIIASKTDYILKPGQFAAYWEIRDAKKGEFSIPAQLDLLVLDIRNEHMLWAYKIGTKLAKKLGGGVDPSMWWTSLIYERHPKLSPYLYTIYKLRCIERIMLENDFTGIVIVGGDNKLHKTIQMMCSEYHWQCNVTESSEEYAQRGFKEKIYYSLPAVARAWIRFIHWLWKIKRKLPYIGKNWDHVKSLDDKLPATIISYFPNLDLKAAAEGRFRSRYWESLHNALNHQANFEQGQHFVRWLFIRFPSPDLSFDQCLKLCSLFQKVGKDGRTYNYLEEFISIRDLGHSICRFFKIALQSFRIQKQFARDCFFQDSRLNFWLYQKEQWAESFRGWRCLERCLQNQAFIHYFELAGKQRWNLFPLENCAWERMLVEASRNNENSGPIYGSQHSIIRPTDFRYFDAPETFKNTECASFQPDIIGGNGKDACSQLLANGMPKERLIQLEALRYLYLKHVADAKTQLPPQEGEPLVNTTMRRLLVLTSFFKDETDAHLNLLAQALNKGLLNEWEITIKPHPYLPVNDWLEGRTDQHKIRLATGPIGLELVSGVCVWASNSTTAALEAALKGLPVMVMLPWMDFDLCPIQNIPGLLRTGTIDDVIYALKNLKPLDLPVDYLDLNCDLNAWRKLLKLNYSVNIE